MRLNDFTVSGSEFTVHGSLRIDTESLGGNTSATDRAHNGFKPKRLTVSLVIRFSDDSALSGLVQLAEVVDEHGKLMIYHIVDPTAGAMGIRQVQFDEAFHVREMPGQKAWRVTFQLAEYLSVPEKSEQRQQSQAPEQQQAEGQSVATGTSSEGDTEDSADLTGFEKVLQWADDQLAPSEQTGTTDAVA